MAQTSRTFRVFVSSTFSDLKEERNALQKYVFPRLRELCMQHGCRFQAIDLRWGVSEEAGLDQQTVKICLQEIKRCQKVTPRPNFVVLLGDRYGWRPLPAEIPAAEYEEIERRVVNTDDQALLKAWYRRDDNAVPAVYCLGARTGDFTDYAKWQEVERRLHSVLLQSTAGMTLEAGERGKYTASATEQEIVCGALNVPGAHEHVFCFFRKITNRDDVIDDLPRSENARDFVDLDENERPDQEAFAQQSELRQRLRDSLPGNIHDYTAEWRADGVTIDHIGTLPETLEDCLGLIEDAHRPSNLCVDVWSRLARVILDEVSKIESVDPLDKEIDDHKNFGGERARFFTGRTRYLDAVGDYVTRPDSHPLALWGESGSGKSALMARAVADVREARSSARIIERYIGATPSSSDGRALLESLCKEITEHYGEDEQSVPTEYQKLVKDFQKRLELATQDKPLVIFLDALDQLSDNEHARNLTWLPNKLPPHVHVIVSTLPGECLSHLERKLPAENMLKLDPMTSSEGDELLDLWLADAQRRLDPAQRESVLKEFMVNGLPLYLKLVFEEARRWKSYSLAQRFPADVPGMIRAMFRRLMSDHGLMLIERALGYIAAARHGLSEDELLDVLSMDKEVFDDFLGRAHHKPSEQRLPVVVWSRLYFDLEPYLTERSADGTNLLGFYHRQLGEVVTGEFLAGEAKHERHIALARFFAGQDYFLESHEAQRERARRLPPTTRPANRRKASELAWQLLRADKWEELEQLLADLPFLEAKAEAGMVFDLAGDFSAAVKGIPSERPLRRILRLLEEALRRDIHFIARHPTTLFQCLWNSCWWYDCPEAARHYETSEGPWSKPGAKLHELLETWRSAREENYRGFCWLRSLRPPSIHLGTAQLAVLRGHEWAVFSVAISSDGLRIVSSSWDVRVWDAESGEELRCLSGHADLVVSVAITSDGRRIVSGSYDKTVRVWDLESGEELRCLRGHDSRVESVAISSDGCRIVSGSLDKTVRVWDAERGDQLRCLFGHEDSVESVAISSDGRRIVSGSYDKSVRVWDVESGEELHCLRGHEHWVTSVAISNDRRRIVSGSGDGTVRVWDEESGEKLHCLRGHEDGVTSVAISSDRRRIFSGSGDGTVRVWDAESGEQLRCLRGHESWANSVAISRDRRRIVSGSKDKTVRVWGGESGEELRCLRGHHGRVVAVAISTDGHRIVTGSWDKTLLVWDAGSGEQLRCLRGHESWVNSVAISRDGRRIVSGSEDQTLRMWGAESGEDLRCLRGHRSGVESVAISTDGRRIVSGSSDGTVRVWDRESGEELWCLRGHGGRVRSVAISSDGSRIVSGSNDETVRVWDAESGDELRCLRVHGTWVDSVAISSDGRRIVSGSSGGAVRVWDAESWECLQVIEVIEGRGDVQAIAAGCPFRAIARRSETMIEDTTGRLTALFPVDLNHLRNHPSGRLWVGASGNHVYFIALERS